MAQIHVSGHASQEEQKLMLTLVRPKHFIPMHGDLRMLKRHSGLAEQVGISKENITVVENGYVIELQDGKVRVGERIPGGYVKIETATVAETVSVAANIREKPAHPGIFVVNLCMDKRTNRLLDTPEIITRNFVPSGDDSVRSSLEQFKNASQRSSTGEYEWNAISAMWCAPLSTTRPSAARWYQ